MVVIWSEKAIEDLKDYYENSRIITEGKVEKYINSLVDYGNSLETFPELGKVFFNYKSFQIRQLIYEMHRIFYYIKDDKVIIIQVIHTRRNIDTVINIIKEYFNYFNN